MSEPLFVVKAAQVTAVLQARLKRAQKVAEWKRSNGEGDYHEQREIRHINWLLEFKPIDAELSLHEAVELVGDAREP